MMVIDQAKGEQNFNKSRPPFRRGGRFDKVLPTSLECTVFRGFYEGHVI